MNTPSQPEFWIERASPADAQDIALALGMLLGEIMQTIGIKVFDCDVEKSEQLLHNFLETGRYIAFVARDRKARVIGVVTLVEGCSVYAGGVMGTIPEFYVDPQWRSSGIGKELAAAAFAYARSSGWKRLEVTTPPLPYFNRTIAFYERQGFSVTGGRKMKLEIAT